MKSDPVNCALRHVSKTSRQIKSAMDAALVPAGLTGNQFNIMMTLEKAGPLNITALGKITGYDPSTLPRLLKPLAQSRYVKMRPGADRRNRIVSITTSGQRTLSKALPLWKAAQRVLLQQVTVSEWESTMTSLRNIRRAYLRASEGLHNSVSIEEHKVKALNDKK